MRVHRVVAAVLVLLAAACSSSGSTAAPETTVAETTTTVPVTSTTAPPVTTTSTTVKPTTTQTTMLQLGPGEATLLGTVSGPGGPVDGATVRVERLVGKAVASTDVTTSGGGAWQVPSILGGSYRVRAFKPPDFGFSTVESFFLAANERKSVDLRVPAAGGDRIVASVTPDPPRLDQPATVTIQIGIGVIGSDGRVAITPRPGLPVALSAAAGFVLETAPQNVTDANGTASWRIRCTTEGATTLLLTLNNTTGTQVRLSACVSASAPSPPTSRR